MPAKRVITKSKNGQWVNEVEGAPELSRSYTSRDEAIEEGEALASERGLKHVTEESEPTGTIVNGGASGDGVAIVGEKPPVQDGPDTTDENGLPLDNPSG
jgi:hypothetical protein